MKRLAIMIAVACLWSVAAGSSAEAQHGHRGYYGNRSAFSISVGNGFSGFTYSNGFPGYYGGFARPVGVGYYGGYRPVPVYRGYYGHPYRGYGYGGGCRHW